MHIPKLSITQKHAKAMPKISLKQKDSLAADHASFYIRSLCNQIAAGTLKELTLGMEDEHLGKYDVLHLVSVIRKHPLRSLESLRIGWMLKSRDHRLVCKELLPMILRKADLKKLQLIMSSWVPESMLWRFLENQSLQEIEIQATRVQRKAQSDPRHNHSVRKYQFSLSSYRDSHSHRDGHRDKHEQHSHHSTSNSSASTGNPHGALQQHNPHNSNSNAHANHHMLWPEEDVPDDNIAQIVPFLSGSVHTLFLKDCDILDDHMEQLISDLHMRARAHTPITNLSLRNNRRLTLTSSWINQIFHSLPELEFLDISLCDLDEDDGQALAAAIAAIPQDSNLKSVNVAGNYRMAESVPSIIKACVESGKLCQFDSSFCDVQNHNLSRTLNTLAFAPSQCVMKSFVSQGSRVHDATSLVNCIRHNTTLRSLVLNHRKETQPLSKQAVIDVSAAMEHNHSLVQLLVDCELQYRKYQQPMKYYLELNRCGRRVLACDEHTNEDGLPWQCMVLDAATSKDPNVLHWFLRNGLELKA
eukprot:CAMPEP_0119545852 /NCGR_PEP_ID=MMETSP1352-20130426/483_1 /TAXON_ID=265584 /ORGANISM="Stauroneis constricta, Strain CCMP1120" /LENGTH=528 /DNA_ID=CAMNT_0007590463 /DNA_START=426 /DNA_END=2012 /DNA_ORIENTATION=-